jgi:hypothetical protein
MPRKLLNFKKVNIFASTLSILLSFQVLILQPILFWLLVFLMFWIIIFSVWKILPKNVAIRREFRSSNSIFLKLKTIFKIVVEDRNYTFFMSPIFLLFGTLSFVLLLKNKILIQISILSFVFLYLLFLDSLYSYFYNKESYFLENIFTVINFTSLFLIYSSLFSLFVIFGVSLWLVIGLFLFFTFLSNHQIFHIYRVLDRINYFYNIAITLVMVQIFWALTFLPTSFYVNGLVLLSVYYSIMGISYFHLRGLIDRIKIIRHLTITLVIIVFALTTARWF